MSGTLQETGFDDQSPGTSMLLPVNVNVISMDGARFTLQIERTGLVSYLRRKIAISLDKPLTQVVLIHGSRVLYGMQSISEVFGCRVDVDLSVFISETAGPTEEIMDFDDPRQLAEYIPDLYMQLKKREWRSQVQTTYLQQQKDINGAMRAILIDWLIDVHRKYRLQRTTLFLAVNLLDRYLQMRQVVRKRLQLVGVVSLWVASKYEEIYPLDLSDLEFCCDGACSKEDMKKQETALMVALDFRVDTPTVSHFADFYEIANGCVSRHKHLMQYILEWALLDSEMSTYLPSQLVAAATFLSNKLLGMEEPWCPTMSNFTFFDEEALKELSSQMLRHLREARTNRRQAIMRKYSTPMFSDVANMEFDLES